ncbi:MAG: hypothetical protein HYS04_13015 [Acidobacteria bacterium]|nr:hypothetical protein [Acidobacteriota bacterium]
MCRNATDRLVLALGLVLAAAPVFGQPVLDWRHIGNSVVEVGLAGLAGGPVDRVWYSPDGAQLYIRTRSGFTFATMDFEHWTPAKVEAPAAETVAAIRLPESGAAVRLHPGRASRLYAIGGHAYRSDDGGASWTNLTALKTRSILGPGLSDAAGSPGNPEELVVAGAFGVWRSLDGGLSWSGLNDTLPNLPVTRLVSVPAAGSAARIELGNGIEAEWHAGEKSGWRAVPPLNGEDEQRQALSIALAAEVTALARAGESIYAGSNDGRLWASLDQGRSWRLFRLPEGGTVRNLFTDAREPLFAAAILEAGQRTRVLRTINGGAFWDDLSDNLPAGKAYAVAADRLTGAVYVAAASGVYMTYAQPGQPASALVWTPLGRGLPAAEALDVRLDAAGNQLYAALAGYGVYATIAPHRFRDPRVVSAADLADRAAAPGALLTVLGAEVRSARAGDAAAPVLAAAAAESQIQVPFEVSGANLALALESSAGPLSFGLPLENTAPAIFAGGDGTPLIMDGETGLLLDGSAPARASARLQVFATGLGRVTPEWKAGTPAPLDSPPKVAATVRAYLDREPVEVTRAILAPGYIGFYLVELQLPAIVNSGPAELYLEIDGRASNRVRLYLEP